MLMDVPALESVAVEFEGGLLILVYAILAVSFFECS